MKDLFKGHHPWLLVLVFTAALLIAGILRHTFLSFGHTDFNANLTFIIVLLAIVSIYALFFEYRRDGSFPKLIVAKPITIAEATASPIVSEEIIANPTTVPNSNIEINERNTWSLDDFSRIKEEITSEVLMAINSKNTEIKDDVMEVSALQINLSKVHHETALAREEEQKQLFNRACDYSFKMLGLYLSPEGMEILFGRIMRFMQAVGSTWEVRSAKELKKNLDAVKITPLEPITKADLLHYGWNIGMMLGKSGLQIGYFLKSTFGHHFDRLSELSISKKLTIPGTGLIPRLSEFHRDFRNRKQQNLDDLVKDYEAEHYEKEKRAKLKKDREEKEARQAEKERIKEEEDKKNARINKMMADHPGLELRQEGDPEDEEMITNKYYSDDYYDRDNEDYPEDDEDPEDDDNDEEDEDKDIDEDTMHDEIMDALENGKMPECFDGFDIEDLSA